MDEPFELLNELHLPPQREEEDEKIAATNIYFYILEDLIWYNQEIGHSALARVERTYAKSQFVPSDRKEFEIFNLGNDEKEMIYIYLYAKIFNNNLLREYLLEVFPGILDSEYLAIEYSYYKDLEKLEELIKKTNDDVVETYDYLISYWQRSSLIANLDILKVFKDFYKNFDVQHFDRSYIYSIDTDTQRIVRDELGINMTLR